MESLLVNQLHSLLRQYGSKKVTDTLIMVLEDYRMEKIKEDKLRKEYSEQYNLEPPVQGA